MMQLDYFEQARAVYKPCWFWGPLILDISNMDFIGWSQVPSRKMWRGDIVKDVKGVSVDCGDAAAGEERM